MSESTCVFCKIIAGEIPALKVFEDDSTLAFVDIGPLAEGHLLVIPKEHYEVLQEMSPEAVAAVTRHLPRLGRAVMDAVSAEGYNVLQNNGRVSGQEVPHVHFHIIPRIASDGLGYRWNASKYEDGRDKEIQQRLIRALQA
ncbi:MAG: HIT family protein [Planctomycetota bacterium]|nr:MAG: HIT family protein [Planctomycetota bacterium]